jgi:uncharacterized repeat protein (TIGR01451 family)
VDYGEHWENQASPAGFMNVLLMDPARPGLIYIGGYGTGLQEYQVATSMEVAIDVPLTPPVGNRFDTTVTVRNFGAAASPSSVRITVPAFVQPTVPAGCAFAAPVLTCQVYAQSSASVPYSVVIPMVANVAASGAIVAQLVPHEPDLNSSNNQATVTIHSGAKADVGVTIAAGTRTADVGGAVSLSLTARNLGPDIASNTRVTIVVPAAYSFTSATTNVGTCAGAGTSTITCSLGDFAKDANAVISLSGTALLVTSGSTTNVEVRSEVTDEVAANNVGIATFVINALPSPPPAGGGGGSAGGSGGGGSYDALALLLLGGILLHRVQRRR